MTAPVVLAQRWEIGGFGGYGYGRGPTFTAGSASATAGFENALVAGAVGTYHSHEHLSGEVRYLYRQGDLKLSSGGAKANLTGDSHVIHYDVLASPRPRESRIRPFFAFGGGAKVYRGTGEQSAGQPLRSIALLTKTQETLPIFSVGGGVSIKIASYLVFRFDVRDYMGPFPAKVIAAAPTAKRTGVMHDIASFAGLSVTF